MHSLLVVYLQVFSIYIVCTHIFAKYGIIKWCHKLLDQNKVKGYQEHLAQAFGNAWSSSLIWQEIWKLNPGNHSGASKFNFGCHKAL